MKTIDRFNDTLVSAYVAPSSIFSLLFSSNWMCPNLSLTVDVRFLLLHNAKNEDAIKNLFSDVHELYIKIQLNPFYKKGEPILSTAFDLRVRMLMRKYLY